LLTPGKNNKTLSIKINNFKSTTIYYSTIITNNIYIVVTKNVTRETMNVALI